MGRRLIEVVGVLVDHVHKSGYQQRALEDDIYAESQKRIAAEKDRDHWRTARQDAIQAGELMQAEIERLQTQLADAHQQRVDTYDDYEGQIAAAEALIDPEANGETTIAGMADEILHLRRELADAQRAASDEFTERQVLTAEQQQDAEIWKQQVDGAQAEVKYLRQQLDAARAETVEVRRRLAEEINRHNATHCEKIELFQQKEWANQHAAELVRERDAALATVSLQRAGGELLNTCLSKIRQHVAGMHEQEDLMEVLVDIRSALEELEEGTEPAPATEAAPCPECEQWQRAKRIDSELVASKAKEIERLRAFVGRVRAVIDHDRDGQEIDEMIKALDELSAGNSEAEGGK